MLGVGEIACGAGFHHAPRVHHDDAVAERHHERQVMADENKARIVPFDHFVENPETIPQIINAEVKSNEDLAIQERPVRAVRVRPVEFTDGIYFTKAPRLRGFVQAEARDGSEVILPAVKPLVMRRVPVVGEDQSGTTSAERTTTPIADERPPSRPAAA